MYTPGRLLNGHHLLLGLIHRKAWKAGEILAVSGLRILNQLLRRPTVRRTKDREALDEQILPVFAADPSCRRILFVGCDWYTRHYEAMFAGREFWTLENDPGRARFGARHHVVADLQHVDAHFAAGSLDLIICNGVIGWGLDDPAAIETAMAACVSRLSPGGSLVLGWNDIPEKTPVAIDDIAALSVLRRASGAFASDIRTETYNRHTFRVLQKASTPPAA